MSEMRVDQLTGESSLVVAGRAVRPQRTQVSDEGPFQKSSGCPYCPGNEGMSPPEIHRSPAGAGAAGRWQTRAFSHPFPVLRLEAGSGFGAHEIIIESPFHLESFWELEPDRAVDCLKTIQKRISDLSRDGRLKYFQAVKNLHASAGAAQEHPHFELFGMPFVPEPVRRLVEAKLCRVCALILAEEPDVPDPNSRIMTGTSEFLALMDFSPKYPWQFSVFPRHHHGLFQEAGETELRDFCGLLSRIFSRLSQLLGNFGLNLAIYSGPTPAGSMHWFLRVWPRLVRKSGFEIAIGIPVVRVAPEDAARFFRERDL